ncbi:MAG: curlin [Kiloniella sp.]|jgi:major curlin subunit|nr:curlin [Kiloniella sp.]
MFVSLKPLKVVAVAAIASFSAAGMNGVAYADAQLSGQLSIGIQGSNPDENAAIANGLFLYALFQGLSGDTAVLQQLGNGNTASMTQGGFGNFGIVEQKGDGHTASLDQSGNQNAFGLFQFGEGTTGYVSQGGSGQSGLLFQFGF